MNIIFGEEKTQAIKDKYTILELDTFLINGQTVKAYCTLENVSFSEVPQFEPMKTLHQNLLRSYANKDWKTSLDLIGRLKGFWNGELDSFYDDLQNRIQNCMIVDPGPEWSHIIVK